jgi:hypothetical protein
MKKVFLSLVVVALFGTMALTSCKSGNTANTDSAATIEEPAPAPVDTAAADTTAADTTATPVK